MDKTKIDWCDSTWNPVTGCLHDCEYCYARGIANRFSAHGERWDDRKIHVLDKTVYAPEAERSEPYPYGFEPTLHRYRLDDYRDKKGRSIFVCSMADLFGEWVPIHGLRKCLRLVRQLRNIITCFLQRMLNGI